MHQDKAAGAGSAGAGTDAEKTTTFVQGVGTVSIDAKLFKKMERKAMFHPLEILATMWGGVMYALSRVVSVALAMPALLFWVVLFGLAHDHAETVKILTAIWTNPADAIVAKDLVVWWACTVVLMTVVLSPALGLVGSTRYDASIQGQLRSAVALGTATVVAPEVLRAGDSAKAP